jgi:hypothetical protein
MGGEVGQCQYCRSNRYRCTDYSTVFLFGKFWSRLHQCGDAAQAHEGFKMLIADLVERLRSGPN